MKIRSVPLRLLSITTLLALAGQIYSTLVSALGSYVWSHAETVSYTLASLYDGLNLGTLPALGIYIVWLVVMLVCTYRIVANSRDRFGEEQMPGPGWAVGYYFIPVMSLFKPYQAISVCTALTYADDPAGPKTERLLGPWWTTWLVSGFAGTISTRLYLQADYDSMSMFVWAELIGVAGSILGFFAIGLVSLIITRIARFQMQDWQPVEDSKTPPPVEAGAAL